MKLISYNVNGIRAALKKEWLEWAVNNEFDIICLQETKAHPDQLDLELFENAGFYHSWVSAEKKGYSGVAILSKQKPDFIEEGIDIESHDSEGRVIRADFGDITVLNCYFPSGTSGEHRQVVKYQFLDDIFVYANELKKERKKLIVCGDYNIAHTENDIHNPKANKKTSGFLPEERAWLTKWFESGFTDSYRYLNPEETSYSWWSYRAGARKNNKGWRIDYISVTEDLKKHLVDAKQLNDAVHSDHCPVLVELNLDA